MIYCPKITKEIAQKYKIKCQEASDPITGHFPCWVKCDRNEPGDKWFWAGYDELQEKSDGTYEAVGLHFQANPYKLEKDILIGSGKTFTMANIIKRVQKPTLVISHNKTLA